MNPADERLLDEMQLPPSLERRVAKLISEGRMRGLRIAGITVEHIPRVTIQWRHPHGKVVVREDVAWWSDKH